MNNYLLWIQIALILLLLSGLLIMLLRRPPAVDFETFRPHFEVAAADNRRTEQAVLGGFERQRGESNRDASALREELATSISKGLENLLGRQNECQGKIDTRLELVRGGLEQKLQQFGDSSSAGVGQLRQELAATLTTGVRNMLDRQVEGQSSIDTKLENFRATLQQGLQDFGNASSAGFAQLRKELNESSIQSRTEQKDGFVDFQSALRTSLSDANGSQETQLANFANKLEKINETMTSQLDRMRGTVEEKLGELQTKNEQKLEEMRRTVDEKLEGTLDRRLGESFKMVSDRLEQVHRGLGEMQSMASSVGDLRKLLTGAKTRGTWGEISLGALLEQILTKEQYAPNVAPRPESSERVEFAVRLPGQKDSGSPVWLPIDAKFPQEDYQRLLEATDTGDAEGIRKAGKALETCLFNQAQRIHDKYVAPPHTTDFAIMFLPSEGLYAEALRRPGLADSLQRDYRVLIAGPTILAALLNSLQIGFRTLAISQQTSDVWKLLGAVKTGFGKFGEVLAKVKKKIAEAGDQIEQTEVRTRAIDRKLRAVEALPPEESSRLLPELATAEGLSDNDITGANDIDPPISAGRQIQTQATI
jgi:DNA recombination protein RmuC